MSEPCTAPTKSQFAEEMAHDKEVAERNLDAVLRTANACIAEREQWREKFEVALTNVFMLREQLAARDAEIARLNGEVDFKRKLCTRLIGERDKINAKIVRLREALQHIANERVSELTRLREIARAALVTTAQPSAKIKT